MAHKQGRTWILSINRAEALLSALLPVPRHAGAEIGGYELAQRWVANAPTDISTFCIGLPKCGFRPLGFHLERDLLSHDAAEDWEQPVYLPSSQKTRTKTLRPRTAICTRLARSEEW
jgi:hypothetical protein